MTKHQRQGVISDFQLFSVILNVMVATGIFTIARAVGEVAGRGAIISIPLAGLLALVQLGTMLLLSRRFPEQTLPEYAPAILGRALGRIYLLVYWAVNLALIVLVSRNFCLLTSAWVFLDTPPWVLLTLFAVVSWNVVRRGVVVLTRVSEIILILTLPVLLLLFVPPQNVDMDHLRPILGGGVLNLAKGVLPAYFSLAGFDAILFVFPFTSRRKTTRTCILAVLAATALYLVTTILVITSLGFERLLLLTWPLQSHLNNYAFAIAERLDVVVLIIWAWQVIGTIMIGMFMAASCLRGVLPQLTARRAADICLGVMLIAAWLRVDLPTQGQLLEIFSYFSLVFAGGLPLLLWLVAKLRRKGMISSVQKTRKTT